MNRTARLVCCGGAALVGGIVLVGQPASSGARAPQAQTLRVSLSSSGAQANGESRGCWISPDGRRVVFDSSATNLVSGDANGVEDVFVRDLASGATRLVSVSSSGE